MRQFNNLWSPQMFENTGPPFSPKPLTDRSPLPGLFLDRRLQCVRGRETRGNAEIFHES